MLGMRGSLEVVPFSDESKVVVGDDKRWIWYRNGEDNSRVSDSFIKYPPSVTVFTIIKISVKSDVILVEGSINTDRYIHTLDCLGFMNGERLAQKGNSLQSNRKIAAQSS
jgi:hypothetical protein